MGARGEALGPRIEAFHSALVQHLEARGTPDYQFTVRTWQQAIVAFFGPRSRQAIHDVTTNMDLMGLIQYDKREGVRVMPEGFAQETVQIAST